VNERTKNLVPESLAPLLKSLIGAQVAKLAAAHPEESFYGFAADTNVAYGFVGLSANTRPALREHCRRYANADDPDGVRAMEELEWQFGDWSYRSFNRADPDWVASWGPIAARIEEMSKQMCEDNRDDEWDEWQERFLRILCRALLDLESAGGFDVLKRDAGFRLCCADHDEAVESGEIRMDKVVAARTKRGD
jgi:hypothetical protein